MEDRPKEKQLEAKVVTLEQRVSYLEKEVADLKQIVSPLSSPSKQIYESMETSPTQARRTVVILGKVGAGKATLANAIACNTIFHLSDSIDSMTRGVRKKNFQEKDISINGVHYKTSFLLLDTHGFQAVNQTDNIKNVTSVNLILFVYKNGRYTPEENDSLTIAVRMLGEDAKQVSALIITGCEDLSHDARKKIIMEFKASPSTKEVADFMEKGIYTVGFPNLTSINEQFIEGYRKTIEEDKAQLWDLVKRSEDAIKPQVSNAGYLTQKVFTTNCIIS